MATAPSWKFEKSQYLRNETTDFDKIWHTDASGPPDTDSKEKISISKIQYGGGRHLEKSKNLNIFSTDWLILVKFGMLMRLDPVYQNRR